MDSSRQQLEEQLHAVKMRLTLLDMIEERLEKAIAEQALTHNLTPAEREDLAVQMRNLNQQV